jgi:hypothetical protein
MAYRRVTSQVLLGGALLVIGLVLLLDTTGVYDTGRILRFAPSLFVLVGVYALVRSGFRSLFGPLVLILIAGAYQLVLLDVITGDQAVQFWPLLLVIFGLSVVFGRRRRASETTEAVVDLFAFFGGSERRATGPFVSASLSSAFGATELDLRDADLAERPAHVSVAALFGGADIVVPRDWNVVIDVLPLFGAAEDDRPRRESEHEGVDLEVTGFVAFGGVTVKD